MDAKKIYLTKEGLDELKKEYQQLNTVRRPELLERVSQARSMGDLSENAEYVAARDELSFVDGRLDELEEIITQASIIQEDHGKGAHSLVKLGSIVIVTVKGKKEEFALVGEWEADPKEKKISHESPLGKALIGKKVGEKIEVEAPAGKLSYTIESIK
jgi:transcription elongation factor GreA